MINPAICDFYCTVVVLLYMDIRAKASIVSRLVLDFALFCSNLDFGRVAVFSRLRKTQHRKIMFVTSYFTLHGVTGKQNVQKFSNLSATFPLSILKTCNTDLSMFNVFRVIILSYSSKVKLRLLYCHPPQWRPATQGL